MTEHERGFRAQVETFGCLGGHVEIVDAPALLRAAHEEPVRLLRRAGFPDPLAGVTLTVSTQPRDEGRVHHFRGDIRLMPQRPDRRAELFRMPPVSSGTMAAAAVLGGVALPLAVAAARTAVHRLQQRRPQDAPVQPAPEHTDDPRPAPDDLPPFLTDPATGLLVEITDGPPAPDGGRTHTAVASVSSDVVGPVHLRAFLTLVLDLARQCAGGSDEDTFLAGRTYVLGGPSDGRRREPTPDGPIRLDHVGGLDEVVRQLREVAVSFNHPAAMARWGARRPQGILMYGPPGTGKTTLAKALATEIGGTLREIRTPEILDKWVGQSERNIKRIFAEARTYRQPTVLLFDEFDSIISYTGAPTDAASQMVNSVAGIFKQEMNTLVEENPNVIVVATTNFPQRVDESLIRSGRFDIKLTVGLPDAAARADILTKFLRQLAGRHETANFRMFADDIDIQRLADRTAGMTGADFKELLRRAQLAKAMAEARGEVVTPIGQQDLERYLAAMRRA